MKYEFMAIAKPFLPEDVRIQLLKDIQKVFREHGGKAAEEDLWGKRHLSYKLKGHEEGYYILYEVELPPESVDKVKQEFRMKNDILRYVIIKKD